MTDSTVIPAIKRKLKESLEANADLDGVVIEVGDERRGADEQIVIGNATSKPVFYGLGSRVPMREDPIRVNCMVQVVRSGSPDYLDLEDRAAEILGALTDQMRADPDLDGTWQFGLVTDFQLSSGPGDKSRLTRITFVLEGKSRHP